MPKDKQIPKQIKETNAINDLNFIPPVLLILSVIEVIKSAWIPQSGRIWDLVLGNCLTLL
jgi:hypothetical protein